MSNNHIKPPPLPTIPPFGPHAVEVKQLHFAYASDSAFAGQALDPSMDDSKFVLKGLDLTLEKGSRCLLIGCNGSGKSTLLRILAGRHLSKSYHHAPGTSTDPAAGSVKVLGLHAFHDTRLNFHRAYLDCDWGMRTVAFVGAAVPLMADIAVRNMMEKLQNSYPERRDELIEMLGINLDWRMHQLSDGQRRRVQIFLGLVRPFQVLLLDEVTTSLDVCVRQDLLRWLVRESQERGATIIYATHIFDGLDDWATHLFYLTDTGRCGWQGRLEELALYQRLTTENHPAKMLAVAENWLRRELEAHRHRPEPAHGALAHAIDPTDHTQGGYSSGRLQTDEEIQAKLERRGRLSDLMGNGGVMDKVRRVGS